MSTNNHYVLSLALFCFMPLFSCGEFDLPIKCSPVGISILTQADFAFDLATFTDTHNKTTIGFLASPKRAEFWQQVGTSWQLASLLQVNDTWSATDMAVYKDGQTPLVFMTGQDAVRAAPGIVSAWVQKNGTMDWQQVSFYAFPGGTQIEGVTAFKPLDGDLSLTVEDTTAKNITILEQTGHNSWQMSTSMPGYAPSLPFVTPDNQQRLATWGIIPDTNTMAVTIWRYDAQQNWQPEYSELEGISPLQAFAYGVDQNTPTLVGGDVFGNLTVWCKEEDWKKAQTFPAHNGMIFSALTLNYNNQLLLASGSTDQTIALWQQEDGVWQCVARICMCSGNVVSLASFIDDNNKLMLVSAHGDGVVFLWDIAAILSNTPKRASDHSVRGDLP